MPSVSVVIPTWNRAELLLRAVRSALEQTLPPLEVLVCDDGSTDNSENLIRAIGDRRVRWIKGERAGRPAIPRNRGIRESRGEWIAFLDNDDEWLPEKLENQLDSADRMCSKAVCSNASRFVPGEGVKGDYLLWGDGRITFFDLLGENRVICSSAMIHRSLLQVVEGFPEGPNLKALEDYALWLRVATLTDFTYVKDPLVIYRDEPESSIRQRSANIFYQLQISDKNFLEWAKGRNVGKKYICGIRANLGLVCIKKLFHDSLQKFK